MTCTSSFLFVDPAQLHLLERQNYMGIVNEVINAPFFLITNIFYILYFIILNFLSQTSLYHPLLKIY